MFEGGFAAFGDSAVSGREPVDGVLQQLDGGFFGLRSAGEGLERKPPGREAGDAESGEVGELVACVERAVALVEEREMAVDVAWRADRKQRADAVAFRDDE